MQLLSFKNLYLIVCIFLKFYIVNTNNLKMDSKEELKSIANSLGFFTNELYQSLGLQSSEAIAVSPLGVYFILGLLYEGATGGTKNELEKLFNFSNRKPLADHLPLLYSSLQDSETLKLNIVNAIYIQEGFPIRTEFSSMCSQKFQIPITSIDFQDDISCSTQINDWITEKTNSKIKNIVSQDDINDGMRMLILNVMHFKSSWHIPFDANLNKIEPFYNGNGETSQVMMMHKTEQLLFGNLNNFNAKFIKLPYIENNFEMIVILPNEKQGLSNLEKQFNWTAITEASVQRTEIELILPKFKIEVPIPLKGLLKNLGLELIFDQKAEFNSISEEPVYVSNILQKVYIEVDEKGTEAVSATVARMRNRRMVVDIEPFIVDHPFIFAIQYVPMNIPLFIGSIRNLQGMPKRDEL